jgi:hypothetical protein
MAKILNRVPVSITAKTRAQLTKKMLLNNRLYDREFEYKNIQKVAGLWVAWYYNSVTLGKKSDNPRVQDGKKTAIRVCNDEGGLPVTGEFSLSGLNIDQRNTMLEVTTIATPLPATPLGNRNSIAIRNLSKSEILYIGKSDVEANDDLGTTAGWQVGPDETYNVDITEQIILYGIVETGTIKVQVRELA